MTDNSAHDAWTAGDSYEKYMGRWSRKIAKNFLGWLSPDPNLTWLEVGCGTGALSAAILDRCTPDQLTGIELSEDFVAAAQKSITDPRATFQTGNAEALLVTDNAVDISVSALMLNFVPDKVKALKEMQRVTKNDGRIAFYVWDYPGGGMQMISKFWEAAILLDPKATELDEAARFPLCTEEGLVRLAKDSGLQNIMSHSLVEDTVFASFDDYWKPFTLGAGPAPGYFAKLAPNKQSALKEALKQTLPTKADGTIHLNARAWGIQAVPPPS